MRPGGANHLQPTKRGWLFLGENGGPCDKACQFCYYAFQDKLIFYDLPTLKGIANLFRWHYGLEYCDISGGEATIYGPNVDGRRPDLESLVKHCSDIGLAPTIITHGQNNTAALVKGIEDAGLEDWLVSLHGMAAGHDRAVVDHRGKGDGGFSRLVDGLKHCTRPVRFNTTLQNHSAAELPDVARWLRDNRPATVWNMIQFNPFFKWSERPEIDFQSRMSDLAPLIGEAVQIAESAGWEVNVRYFPFCVANEYGFAKNCVNYYGTQQDHWEWSLIATERLPMEWVRQQGGAHAANRHICDEIAKRRGNALCGGCAARPICEGPSEQYQARYGVDELRPFVGGKQFDIAWFDKGGTLPQTDKVLATA